MTRIDMMQKHNLSKEILNLYEDFNDFHDHNYSDEDLCLLSLIVTFDQIGMTKEEIATYFALQKRTDTRSALCLLNKKRAQLLDELYAKQKQLDEIDYLRTQIRNA